MLHRQTWSQRDGSNADHQGTNLALCLLSYAGLEVGEGVEPPSDALQASTWPLGQPTETWCGERDSNPCHRVGNAISWPLDDPSTKFGADGES